MANKEVIKIEAKKYIKGQSDKKKSKLRVAAYARVSTELDDQLNSLVAQRTYYEKFIKENPDWVFVDIYFD